MQTDLNHEVIIEPAVPMLTAALDLAATFGWKTFPARMEDGKKWSWLSANYSPSGENWGMTNDPKQLAANFNNRKWKHKAGVGIPTGEENGIWVLEADTKDGHDVDGLASLRDLEARYGKLPDTLMAESPSGSVHYYFNWSAKTILNSTSKIAPGIDVRGEGGMVIAPPSVRADGAYRWLNEGMPIADAPPWLIELATKDDAPRTAENSKPIPDYLSGVGPVGLSTDPRDYNSREADPAKVAAAMAVIPNDDVSQNEYNTVGMACWAATGGSDAGFEIFDQWARKSKKKYHGGTVERWRNYWRHPPTRIGAGSIFRWASEIDPDWWKRIPAPESKVDERPTSDQGTQKKPCVFKATPFVWVDPTQIPKRQWLYPPHYIREFFSVVFSSGGKGKSSLLIAEALAMVSGRKLLDIYPEGQLRVWYWNGEDPMVELQRRFAAAIKHYELKPEDIGDRLFIDSGRTLPIVIAEEGRYGAFICEPVINDVIATLRENRIDVLIIDPFVSCHRVSENDNPAIDRVAKSWSGIAEEARCSIALAHHTRKSGGERATVDDGRGASALRDAARTARTINTMTDGEAERAEIEGHKRGYYFRADVGKANLTPPAEYADWYKFISVDLGNTGGKALEDGDKIGVVTPWVYPVADMPKITPFDILRVQATLKADGPWRADQRSKKEPWVGIPIAKELGLDLLSKVDQRAVAKLISDWLVAGLLKRVERRDDHHELRSYVEAGADPVVPTTAGRDNE